MCSAGLQGIWPKEGTRWVFYLLNLTGGTERKEVLPKYRGICCCSASKLCPTLRLCGRQHARLLGPPPAPGVCPDSGPLSPWCHLTISPAAATHYFRLQSPPASGSFPMSRLFWKMPRTTAYEAAWELIKGRGTERRGEETGRKGAWMDSFWGVGGRKSHGTEPLAFPSKSRSGEE